MQSGWDRDSQVKKGGIAGLTGKKGREGGIWEAYWGPSPGRPSVDIPPEVLEDLHGLGFTWDKIARIFRVSRWTIMRELVHLT